jgi:hypothetical protein
MYVEKNKARACSTWLVVGSDRENLGGRVGQAGISRAKHSCPSREGTVATLEPNGAEMKVEVVCYSGYKVDERPVRFRLGGQDYFVEELLDQWYGPQDVFFKVKANDGDVYILRRRSTTPEGEWSLESFRDIRRGG